MLKCHIIYVSIFYFTYFYITEIILFHLMPFSLTCISPHTKHFIIICNCCTTPLHGDIIQPFTCHWTMRMFSRFHIRLMQLTPGSVRRLRGKTKETKHRKSHGSSAPAAKLLPSKAGAMSSLRAVRE